MRFGFIHRLMTDALAALGVLALVSSGELPRTVNVMIIVGLAIALALPERWQAHPWTKRMSAVVPLALLGVQLFRLFAGSSILEVAVEFAAALQIVRLASRRGAAHDQQVIVLALLHLIAGTVLGGGIGYGLCFLGFLVIAPAALVLSHLRREVEGNYRQGARDRTGLPVDVPRILRSRRVVDRPFLLATCLLSIPIFCFTAGIFVLFPRVGLSLLMLGRAHPGRLVGFSDKVDLSEVGVLRNDPTIVMRVEAPDLPPVPPPRLALHLRGTAFDTYDGHAWSKSARSNEPLAHDAASVLWLRRPTPFPQKHVMHVELEPIDPPVLFFPVGTVGLRVRQRGEPPLGARLLLMPGPEGELRYSGTEGRGIAYDIYLGRSLNVAPEPLRRADFARYLSLPASLPRRIRQLAHSIVATAPANATAFNRAEMVEDYLRRSYSYDLASPSGAAADPIDDFLFHSHRGHCEYYSTAMVLLLRELGIPARNVTGFIGGSYNRFGHYYAVRQGDAHSWVEAYFDDRGWTTFDPTPPSDAAPRSELSGWLSLIRDMVEASSERWERYVIGYDLRQQAYLFEAFSRYTKAVGPNAPMRLRLGRMATTLLVLAAACALVAFFWRRMRSAGTTRPTPNEDSSRRDRVLATALYEALDLAMQAQGIGRGASTPPLRHAEALSALGHPLADEILQLTDVYLDARFGELRLTDALLREIDTRIKRLRSARLPATVEPSAPS